MNAIRPATAVETSTEFVMMTRERDKQIVGERSLTRNICTGKLTYEFLDKTGHLDKQVIVFGTEHGRKLEPGDLMLVNQTLSMDYPHFYLDVCVSVDEHHVKGKVKPGAPFHWDFCHKVLSTTDPVIRDANKLTGLSLAVAQEAFPEKLYISKEMIEAAGFKVTEDDGQYVKAVEVGYPKNGVRRQMAINRERCYVDVKSDAGTRTTFSGWLTEAHEFATVIKCAY